MKIGGIVRLLGVASLIATAESQTMAADIVKPASPVVETSVGSLLAFAETQLAAADAPQVGGDATGNLRVPDNYRTTFEFLGSWAIAADNGKGSQQIHVVYVSPGSIEAYQKEGHFPDGAVLVKEVFETATADMTTGTVSRAQNLKGWFVMVRDSKNTHPGNKLWGDGWGWSWFDASDPVKTTSTDFQSDCQGCHIPAKATDWIYVQGYPALKR